MSVIGSSILAGASGSAGGGPLYVDDVFSTTLYEGKSTLSGNVVVDVQTGIDNVNETTLVWIKNRDASFSHKLGILSGNQLLESDTTSGQSSNLQISALTDGVRLPSYSAYGNRNGENFVCWNFKAAPGFFDRVTWSGDSNAGRQIAHNLSSVPGIIIIKCTSTSDDWIVYHRSLGFSQKVYLNGTADASSMGSRISAADASTFTPGSDNSTNATGRTYVAYIFAHDDAQFGTDEDESIIKCGSYTGNGSNLDINLGFEPQWLLIKCSSHSTTDWLIADTMRGSWNPGTSNDNMTYLRPNRNQPESTTRGAEPTSTGFRVRGAMGNSNASGRTYIYMAIRRPNKPPELATEVFAMNYATESTGNRFTTGFPVDLTLSYLPNNGVIGLFQDRLRGYPVPSSTAGNYSILFSSSANPESVYNNSSPYLFGADSNTSIGIGSNLSGNISLIHAFKRAPGFMDVVTFSGTGSNLAVNHNLDAIPELILHKNRTSSTNWIVSTTPLYSSGKMLNLSSNGGPFGGGTSFMTSTPTASQILLSSSSSTVNASGNNYIQYLFATLPGVSKVGSYSGNTGYAVNVNCGFTNGARFIMIKRIDEDVTGDWYVWDSVRGIVSGNDPYLLLNTTAAQVTNTDYIDPNIYGFTVTSSAPAALNTSGGTYLFLAIA